MPVIGAAALVVTVLTLVVTVVGLGKDWKAGVLACAVVLAVLVLLLVVAWLATRQRRAAPQDVEPVSRRHGPSPPMEWMEPGHFVTFTDSFYRSGSDDDRPVTAVAEIEAIDNGRVRLLWRSGEDDGMPTEVSLTHFRSTLTGLRCPAAGIRASRKALSLGQGSGESGPPGHEHDLVLGGGVRVGRCRQSTGQC